MKATATKSTTPPTRTDLDEVFILDFGAQYAQLIARRVREQGVYCELVRHDISPLRIHERQPKGIILSGGPNSVYDPNAPACDPELFQLGIPVLGICYGMQLACHVLGGDVASAPAREFRRAHAVQLQHQTNCLTGCLTSSRCG